MPPSRGLPALSRSGWSASFVAQCRARSLREDTRSFSIAATARPRIQKLSHSYIPIAGLQHTSIRNASWFSRSQPEPQPQTASPNTFVPDDAPTSASPSATLHPQPKAPLEDTADLASSLSEQPSYTNDFIGFLEKDYGIDFGWGPSSVIKFLFEHVYVYSSLGFAGSIIATAAMIRGAMIFAQKANVENSTKMQAMSPITKPLMDQAREASMAGNKMEAAKARQELSRVYKDAGIQVWKFGLAFLHIPFGFGCWRTFRNMADIPVMGMTTGGFAWFPNLTVADPLFILPIATATLQYYSAKWSVENNASPAMSAQQRQLQNVLVYGLPFLSLAIISWAPAAVQLNFCTTAFFALLTNMAFTNATVRAWLGMHKKPTPEPPTVNYKGTINRGAKSSPTGAGGTARPGATTPPPSTPGSRSGILGAPAALWTGAMDTAKKLLPDAKERKSARVQKLQRSKAQQYELRRKREIQEERVDFERRMR